MDKKGVIRNCCPKCGGKIVVSSLCQYTIDRRVTKTGRLSKSHKRIDNGCVGAEYASCSECGLNWEDGDFFIGSNEEFIDFTEWRD